MDQLLGLFIENIYMEYIYVNKVNEKKYEL